MGEKVSQQKAAVYPDVTYTKSTYFLTVIEFYNQAF